MPAPASAVIWNIGLLSSSGSRNSRRVRHQEAPAAVRASRCAAAAQGGSADQLEELQAARESMRMPSALDCSARSPPGGRWASAGAFVARTL